MLIGFSHFEDFLTKAIKSFLISYPGKNGLKVDLNTVRGQGNNLISFSAEKQARHLTFAEKIKFIEKNFSGLSQNILNDIKIVNDIRNCLMHNNGLADNRLVPKYTVGQKIILSSGEVNGFGLQARQLAREIWGKI